MEKNLPRLIEDVVSVTTLTLSAKHGRETLARGYGSFWYDVV